MKTIDSTLITAIKNGTWCVLLRVDCTDGTTFAYTNHDVSITRGSVTYKSAPGLSPQQANYTADGSVQDATLAAAWVDAPEADIIAGKFDEATMTVLRTDWTNLDPAAPVVVDSINQITNIQWTKDGFTINVESNLRKFVKPLGYVTTATCPYKFGSPQDSTHPRGCGVNLASWTYTKTITSVTDARNFHVGLTGAASGRLTAGQVTFTSGQNSGVTREISGHTAGSDDQLTVFIPLPYVPAIGDSVTVVAGCKKSVSECQFFSNIANFGGHPNIVPEVNTSI